MTLMSINFARLLVDNYGTESSLSLMEVGRFSFSGLPEDSIMLGLSIECMDAIGVSVSCLSIDSSKY